MNSKIAVIGKGNVGGALTRGLERWGHELRTIGKAAADVRSAGAWADVVVLAVPYPAIDAWSESWETRFAARWWST